MEVKLTMNGTALALPNPSLILSGPVGSLEAYVERVSGIPMLGRDEEFALARRFRRTGKVTLTPACHIGSRPPRFM